MNKKSNIFLIILLILNFAVWFYYFIIYTNYYKTWFNDFETDRVIVKKSEDMKIQFYDNYDQNLIIIKTPTKRTILINTGNDPNAKYIREYISKNNLFYIDKIFITNNNTKSTKGLSYLLNNIAIGQIIDGTTARFDDQEYNYLLYFLKHHPEIGYIRANQNQNIYVDPYIEIKTFFAVDEIGQKFGDMFVLISYNETNILLTSENSITEQTYFLDYAKKNDSGIVMNNVDILEYPNVPYMENILPAFIDAIKPRYLIVGQRAIFEGAFIDMNVWNTFNKNRFYVKYINHDSFLTLITDGKKIKFKR